MKQELSHEFLGFFFKKNNIQTNLEWMPILSFVYSRQDTLVNSKGHSRGNQCQGHVGQDRYDGDISNTQEENQDESKNDSRISWILPID